MTLPSRQLLAFGFDAHSAFEGQLVGALERLESGGALRILDVRSCSISGSIPPHDAAQPSGLWVTPRAKGMGQVLRDLGASLQPGSAFAAVLVEHTWSRALEDAVSRVGGRSLASEFVDASRLSELADDLLRVAR